MLNHSTLSSAARLSDRDLLDATTCAASLERSATAGLLALLAELDSRKLYLGEGCSSLFTYCTQVLHLSEPAAYSRITAARAARRFPIVLARLADGDLTITSITLLAAHLTDENHEALLDAARHASKRDIERLVADLYPQPDLPASVRRVPASETRPSCATAPAMAPVATLATANAAASVPPPASLNHRVVTAPLAADRYCLRVTISAETQTRLDRARDLLRHTVPNGDIAVILDRALAVLVEQLERRKAGRMSRRTPTVARSTPPPGRHIPAAVKRDVWTRDEGRCAFVGPQGRCRETGFLEYHHVRPYARGGASDATNLELRCRAHNQFEAEQQFGPRATM